MRFIQKIKNLYSNLVKLPQKLEIIQEALGRIESRQVASAESKIFDDVEFQVYSQWGEDGIIQYLLRNVHIDNKKFIEFGVENYTQSNTRFLLKNNNWSGLVIDGSNKNVEYIKNDPIYWLHNLKALQAFITKDNINELFANNGLHGDIGLLSIDIDGNDYWVWQAIDSISPRIIICEYNSRFGSKLKLTTPYDEKFIRSEAHYSNLYYGASIAALVDLGNQKGYQLVAGNRAGNNLFFVRNDLMTNLSPISIDSAYVKAQFREARNSHGELIALDWTEGFGSASDLPVVNLETGALVSLRSLDLLFS